MNLSARARPSRRRANGAVRPRLSFPRKREPVNADGAGLEKPVFMGPGSGFASPGMTGRVLPQRLEGVLLSREG